MLICGLRGSVSVWTDLRRRSICPQVAGSGLRPAASRLPASGSQRATPSLFLQLWAVALAALISSFLSFQILRCPYFHSVIIFSSSSPLSINLSSHPPHVFVEVLELSRLFLPPASPPLLCVVAARSSLSASPPVSRSDWNRGGGGDSDRQQSRR